MYTKEYIIKRAVSDARFDIDIAGYVDDIGKALEVLLDGCNIVNGLDSTSYTWTLLSAWYNFVDSPNYNLPGGSAADYCAESVQRTFNNLNIHLENASPDIQQELINWINAPAEPMFPWQTRGGVINKQMQLDLLAKHGII